MRVIPFTGKFVIGCNGGINIDSKNDDNCSTCEDTCVCMIPSTYRYPPGSSSNIGSEMGSRTMTGVIIETGPIVMELSPLKG